LRKFQAARFVLDSVPTLINVRVYLFRKRNGNRGNSGAHIPPVHDNHSLGNCRTLSTITQIFNFRVLKTEYPASILYCLSMETRLCLFSVNKRLQNQKHPAQHASRGQCKYFFYSYSFNNIYTLVPHIDSVLKLPNINS
jgi:hypothetical protein